MLLHSIKFINFFETQMHKVNNNIYSFWDYQNQQNRSRCFSSVVFLPYEIVFAFNENFKLSSNMQTPGSISIYQLKQLVSIFTSSD